MRRTIGELDVIRPPRGFRVLTCPTDVECYSRDVANHPSLNNNSLMCDQVFSIDSKQLTRTTLKSFLTDTVSHKEIEQKFTDRIRRKKTSFDLKMHADLLMCTELPHICVTTMQAVIVLIKYCEKRYLNIFDGALLFSGIIVIPGKHGRLITPIGQYVLKPEYREMDESTLLNTIREDVDITFQPGVVTQITSVDGITVPPVSELYLYDSNSDVICNTQIGRQIGIIVQWVSEQVKWTHTHNCVLTVYDCRKYMSFNKAHQSLSTLYFVEVAEMAEDEYERVVAQMTRATKKYHEYKDMYEKKLQEHESYIQTLNSSITEHELVLETLLTDHQLHINAQTELCNQRDVIRAGVVEKKLIFQEMILEERFEEAVEYEKVYNDAVRDYQSTNLMWDETQRAIADLTHKIDRQMIQQTRQTNIVRLKIKSKEREWRIKHCRWRSGLEESERTIKRTKVLIKFWKQFMDV